MPMAVNYYKIEPGHTSLDMQKIKTEPNSLSLFHLNTGCLNKNFDDLEYLIKTTNQTFNVIAISESIIKSNVNITTNINLPNYSIEYTPTQSHTEGTLLCISNKT